MNQVPEIWVMVKRVRKPIDVLSSYTWLSCSAAMSSLLRWESFLTGMLPLTAALGISSNRYSIVTGDHLLEDGSFYFCGFLGSCNACLLFLLIRCLRAAASGQESIFTPYFYSIFSNLSVTFEWKSIPNGPLLGNSLPESSLLWHLVDLRDDTSTYNLWPVNIVYLAWTHLRTRGNAV